MDATVKELNALVSVVGDLARVVAVADASHAQLKQTRQRMAQADGVGELLRGEVAEAQAKLDRDRNGLESGMSAAAQALQAGRKPTTPLEYLLAEGAIQVLHVVSRATALRSSVVADLASVKQRHDSAIMTGIITNVIGLCELSRVCSASFPTVAAFVRQLGVECKTQVLDHVLANALTRMEWANVSTAQPLMAMASWPEASSWVAWAVSLDLHCGEVLLQQPRTLECLKPFVDPFRKKFFFHFLDASSSMARTELFREASKHALEWISLRHSFLAAEVQELLGEVSADPPVNALAEFVRALSLLMVQRVRRDFTALIGGDKNAVSPDDNRVFYDIADEVFAWSATLEEAYGYALVDGRLTHVLLEAVVPMFESPVTQHWLALEGASALAAVDEAVNATYGNATESSQSALVAAVLTDLLSRTRTRVAVLPHAWQRRAFLMHVHTPALRRTVEHITRLVDGDLLTCVESNRFEWLSSLGQLHYIGTVLAEWSVRPEYDQDEDALATLAQQCLERCARECARVALSVSEVFVSNLGPWLARNWLYVTGSQAELLTSGFTARLDMTPELCVPFERLREWMRNAANRLGATLFTQFALALASHVDRGMLERLAFQDKLDLSVELARQLDFDASVVFGVWAGVTDNPRLLFKHVDDALRILRMDGNQLMVLCCVDALPEEHQQQEILHRFGILNLSGAQAVMVAKLRKDVGQ